MKNSVCRKLSVALNAVLNERVKEEIDDTLLQKFVSFMKESKGSNGIFEDILRNSDFLTLLYEVLSSKNWKSVGQSFALQLVDVLILHYSSSNKELFKDDILRINTCAISAIKYSLKSKSSPSVQVAAINCLNSLHDASLLQPTDVGLLEVVLLSLFEKSYFVHKTAHRFIANCFKECSDAESSVTVTSELEKVLRLPLLMENGETELVLIGILDGILIAVKENNNMASWLRKNTNFYNSLLKVLERSGPGAVKACEIFGFVLNAPASRGNNKDVIHFLEYLASFQDPLLLLKFTYSFLQNEETILPGSLFLEILYLPLVGEVNDTLPLEETVLKLLNSMMANTTSSQALVTSSLTMLHNLVPKLHQSCRVQLLKILRTKFSLKFKCRKTVTLFVQLQHKLLHSDEKTDVESSEIVKYLESLQDLLTSSFTISILIQTLQMILRLLRLWSSKGMVPWEMDIFVSLAETVKRKLVDRQWEVIDSGLEFIVNVLDIPHSEDWICTHKLHSAVWLVVNVPHSNGYAMASAIKALSEMCSRETIWKKLVSDECLNMEKVCDILLQYLEDDTDVFVQRAAATAIQKLDARNPKIYYSLHRCTCSLDWELKSIALRTWEKIMKDILDLHSSIDGIIKQLYETGLLSSIVTTLTDCDRTVRLLSAQIALHLKTRLEEKGFKPIPEHIVSNSMQENVQPTHLINFSPKTKNEKNKILEDVLNLDMKEYLIGVIRFPEEGNMQNPPIAHINDRTCNELLQYIWDSDLSSIIEETSTSTDIYTGNFEALLDDILAAIEESDVMESQVIDCY